MKSNGQTLRRDTLYTVDEFERILRAPSSDDHRYELIDGRIYDKRTTEEHGYISGLIVTEIGLYLMQYPIGRVAIKALHRPKDDLHNDRIPDVSYVSGRDRPLEDVGAALYMPDLCVEVQLPDQTRKFLRHKAEYYLKNNTRLVWLVFPRQQIIEVWTTTEQLILTIEDTLTGGDVLPGFAVPVKRFFV